MLLYLAHDPIHLKTLLNNQIKQKKAYTFVLVEKKLKENMRRGQPPQITRSIILYVIKTFNLFM